MSSEERTVLVLGAGASVPYRFPTGKELVKDICQNFLTRFGPLEPPLRAVASDFVARLGRAAVTSIDAFLQRNEHLWGCGKLAIASSLLPCERNLTLFDDLIGQEHFYQKLGEYFVGASLDDCCRRPASVITFNYDRSLEHFLVTSFANLFNVEEESAATVVNRLRILHIHGKLGWLPWQQSNEGVIPYGLDVPIETPEWRLSVREAAKHIRVIYDGSDNPVLQEAHACLRDADRVIFLGFGYDPVNLRKLALRDTLRRGAHVCGTVHGFSQPQHGAIRAKLQDVTGGIIPDLRCETCLDFARNTPWLQAR